MAKKEDTIQFLNQELDKKSKKLKLVKIKDQESFDVLVADKVKLKYAKTKSNRSK